MTGAAILPLLPAIAALRISVFREFPYLYDGDAAYEEDYLQIYASARHATVVVAEDDGKVVGASTCLPMSAEAPNVQKPFLDAGQDISSVFYFGESVLNAAYRGQGIGVAFFARREAQARANGYTTTCFCAVQRVEQPIGYTPLDAFWTRRGYSRQPHLACKMSWRDVGEIDVGEIDESEKTLVFWTKQL